MINKYLKKNDSSAVSVAIIFENKFNKKVSEIPLNFMMTIILNHASTFILVYNLNTNTYSKLSRDTFLTCLLDLAKLVICIVLNETLVKSSDF